MARFGKWLLKAARWQRSGFTMVEVLVALAIFATLVGLAVHAAREAAARKAAGQEPAAPESWSLRTERHDGHLWVIHAGVGHFVHHPGCDRCLNAEQEGGASQ